MVFCDISLFNIKQNMWNYNINIYSYTNKLTYIIYILYSICIDNIVTTVCLILNAKHSNTIYISSSLYWSIVKLPKIFEKAAISPQKTIFLCLQHIKFTRLFRSKLSPRGLWWGSNMIINHLSLSVDELPVQTM